MQLSRHCCSTYTQLSFHIISVVPQLQTNYETTNYTVVTANGPSVTRLAIISTVREKFSILPQA